MWLTEGLHEVGCRVAILWPSEGDLRFDGVGAPRQALPGAEHLRWLYVVVHVVVSALDKTPRQEDFADQDCEEREQQQVPELDTCRVGLQ